MAFMSQDRKAIIAAELKRVMPQGWKYSLGVRHRSTIVLNIWQAPADLLGIVRANVGYEVGHHFDLYMPRRADVLKGAPAEIAELFDRIAEALYRGNHDRSDSMTDYFDVGWYVDVNIGSFEKPFVNTIANAMDDLQREILKTAAWLDLTNAGVHPATAERCVNEAMQAAA